MAAVVASLAPVLTVGCSRPPVPSTVVLPPVRAEVGASAIPAFYTPPSSLADAAAGSLLRVEQVRGVPGVPASATVWRILYGSRAPDGGPVAESGYVIAPGGQPPRGGWPILAWAHATTGFAVGCAPSLFHADGPSGPYLVPGLQAVLATGFVVSAADYQGLGVAGIHPYLVGASAARSVLDAAAATRHVPGLSTSDRVVVFGHSEGGQAALFAGQLARQDAPQLRVVGVATVAPVTHLPLLWSAVSSDAGVLDFSLPLAYTWAQTYHDLAMGALFTPEGAAVAEAVVPAGCLSDIDKAIALDRLTPQEVFRPALASNRALEAHARANDPGHVPAGAPLLVVQGTADRTVLPALTGAFVRDQACDLGDTVDYVPFPGAGHSDVVAAAEPLVLRWALARLAGHPAPSTC